MAHVPHAAMRQALGHLLFFALVGLGSVSLLASFTDWDFTKMVLKETVLFGPLILGAVWLTMKVISMGAP